MEEDDPKLGVWDFICAPVNWLKMLGTEIHWSFVLGVILIYGVSQGVGGSLYRVGTEYYMKDVQKVQPSRAQIYQGITSIPWMVKPLWGLMTDVIPVFGYRRRPYFILAGIIGIVSMLFISLHDKLHISLAVISLTVGRSGVAIADVTVDACVAQNSNKHQHLAADMQSLCSLSAATGSLLGFLLSGVVVHLIGPKGVYGLMVIPFAFVFLVGIVLDEHQAVDLSYRQEFVGYILSVGSVGALFGAVLYQYALKDHDFRSLCFWTQLCSGLSGMLDLILVLRMNLKIGIPDHIFAVLDECASQLITRIKWMPLLVLSAKLCPAGIEGTFFALIMSIDNVGLATSSWLGGILLHIFKITITKFDNLWIAIFVRNIARVIPLFALFLVPKTHFNSSLLPSVIHNSAEDNTETTLHENIELVSLVASVDNR